MVPIDIPPMLQGFAGSSRPKKRRVLEPKVVVWQSVTNQITTPTGWNVRLKWMKSHEQTTQLKNPQGKCLRWVGLLTSFKLYKGPWTNCVRSDFLRLIKSNHADHWMPAAGEKNWRFFIQKHDFQQHKLLTKCKKNAKMFAFGEVKKPA